jgi:homoserine acetyltransferase
MEAILGGHWWVALGILDIQLLQAAEQYDANHLLYLMRAHRAFDVAEVYGSMDAALGRIQAETLIVCMVDDQMASPEEMRQVGQTLTSDGVTTWILEVPSEDDHMGCLTDQDLFGPAIGQFLP